MSIKKKAAAAVLALFALGFLNNTIKLTKHIFRGNAQVQTYASSGIAVTTVNLGGKPYAIERDMIYLVVERPESAFSKHVLADLGEQASKDKLSNILSKVGHLGILYFDENTGQVLVSEQVNYTRTIPISRSEFANKSSFLMRVDGVEPEVVKEITKKWINAPPTINYVAIGRNCTSHVIKILNEAGLDLNDITYHPMRGFIRKSDGKALYKYMSKHLILDRIKHQLNKIFGSLVNLGGAFEFIMIKIFHVLTIAYNFCCIMYNLFFSHIIPFDDFFAKLFATPNTFIEVGLKSGNIKIVLSSNV